jgi:hypothetical protein
MEDFCTIVCWVTSIVGLVIGIRPWNGTWKSWKTTFVSRLKTFVCQVFHPRISKPSVLLQHFLQLFVSNRWIFTWLTYTANWSLKKDQVCLNKACRVQILCLFAWVFYCVHLVIISFPFPFCTPGMHGFSLHCGEVSRSLVWSSFGCGFDFYECIVSPRSTESRKKTHCPHRGLSSDLATLM